MHNAIYVYRSNKFKPKNLMQNYSKTPSPNCPMSNYWGTILDKLSQDVVPLPLLNSKLNKINISMLSLDISPHSSTGDLSTRLNSMSLNSTSTVNWPLQAATKYFSLSKCTHKLLKYTHATAICSQNLQFNRDPATKNDQTWIQHDR